MKIYLSVVGYGTITSVVTFVPSEILLFLSPTIRGLLLASHQVLAIPATPWQQHLQPHLVIYYDNGDSSYIHNYGSKYALQHGYPHALPYSMQYPKATSSI